MRRRTPRVRCGLAAVVGAGCLLATAPAGAATSPTSAATVSAPVGVVERAFVDRSRATPADPSGGITPAPTRTLPTRIYYPARRGAPGTVTPRARPTRGAHPVVLFHPGSPGTPEDYEPLLADWASHGYVVAGIEFPISSVTGPDDVAWQDLPAQTKDARFVLGKLLALDPAKAGIPRIDEDRIAAAGHSFGGATALSLVSKCCRDRRIRATVALAAVAETRAGPRLRRTRGPLLFVHARNDRAVAYTDAAALCETAKKPKRFVVVEGIRGLRAHVDPYIGDGAHAAAVRPAIVDFLDGYVRGRKAARTRLDRAGKGTTVVGVTRCRPSDTPPSRPTTSAPLGTR